MRNRIDMLPGGVAERPEWGWDREVGSEGEIVPQGLEQLAQGMDVEAVLRG